jgi:hypothetical protein
MGSTRCPPTTISGQMSFRASVTSVKTDPGVRVRLLWSDVNGSRGHNTRPRAVGVHRRCSSYPFGQSGGLAGRRSQPGRGTRLHGVADRGLRDYEPVAGTEVGRLLLARRHARGARMSASIAGLDWDAARGASVLIPDWPRLRRPSPRRRPAAHSRWPTPATSTRRCRWCAPSSTPSRVPPRSSRRAGPAPGRRGTGRGSSLGADPFVWLPMSSTPLERLVEDPCAKAGQRGISASGVGAASDGTPGPAADDHVRLIEQSPNRVERSAPANSCSVVNPCRCCSAQRLPRFRRWRPAATERLQSSCAPAPDRESARRRRR